MRRGATLLILLVTIGLVLAACSSSSSGSKGSEAPAVGDAATVRFVSQNILHGTACAPDTNRCDLPGRAALFVRQLAENGCPELVGLQEANQFVVDALTPQLAKVCGGSYKIVRDSDAGNDREVVLTTLEVLGSRREKLAGPLRTAFWVRAASEAGIVDFVTTHLASSSDNRPCDTQTCPPPCQAADTLKECQARGVVALVDKLALPESIVVVGGDLNAEASEPAAHVFADQGWIDTHVKAGNAECNPSTGSQCTSGRVDDDLSDLKNPNSKQGARIDYLWLAGKRPCDVVAPTGLFNGAPATNGPDGLAFPSDHTGVQAELSCPTSDAQYAAASGATLPPAPTTSTIANGKADPATTAAITKAFTTLYGGATGVDEKITAVEDGEQLRTFLTQTYESTKAIASRIKVRMDAISLDDGDHASVTYTLLLDGAPVLDHLAAKAVLKDGTWLVTRRSFCDVSTQGAKEIPPACQG